MGWAGGSSLLDDVAKLVMPLVPREKRLNLADKLIELFENEDCDTIDECEQPDIARAYKTRFHDDE